MVKMLTMKELKLLRMLFSEDEYKDNLETSSMNTSLDAGLKLISSSSTSRSVNNGRYHIKQRCLILCSRGEMTRHYHFLEDLRTLILHTKKDSKLVVGKGAEGVGQAVNDIAEIRGCTSVLFLECRKLQYSYLWLSRTRSNGPSARFLIQNIHTMDELRLTSNCMKGSSPILQFHSSFG